MLRGLFTCCFLTTSRQGKSPLPLPRSIQYSFVPVPYLALGYLARIASERSHTHSLASLDRSIDLDGTSSYYIRQEPPRFFKTWNFKILLRVASLLLGCRQESLDPSTFCPRRCQVSPACTLAHARAHTGWPLRMSPLSRGQPEYDGAIHKSPTTVSLHSPVTLSSQ